MLKTVRSLRRQFRSVRSQHQSGFPCFATRTAFLPQQNLFRQLCLLTDCRCLRGGKYSAVFFFFSLSPTLFITWMSNLENEKQGCQALVNVLSFVRYSFFFSLWSRGRTPRRLQNSKTTQRLFHATSFFLLFLSSSPLLPLPPCPPMSPCTSPSKERTTWCRGAL